MDTAREIIDFALHTVLDQWKDDQIEIVNLILEKKEENKKMGIKRQRQLAYGFDQRRTLRKLTGNVTPMNDLEPEVNEECWAGRWSKEVDFNPVQMDAFYKLSQVWTNEEGETMVEQLTDEKKMLRLIRQKGNLSAPGYDALTFPILKLEADASAKMMVELLRSLIAGGRCPIEWKVGKTILLYKAGDDQNPANYRPITLTSILYRIIFGRISQ
jgi:hypothetical protein